MRKPILIAGLFSVCLLAAMSLSARASEQTVTLDVPGMTCAACPITVKTALNRVDGIQDVKVNLEQREARVTFEDIEASVDKLTEATTNAGYPSTVKEK